MSLQPVHHMKIDERDFNGSEISQLLELLPDWKIQKTQATGPNYDERIMAVKPGMFLYLVGPGAGEEYCFISNLEALALIIKYRNK